MGDNNSDNKHNLEDSRKILLRGLLLKMENRSLTQKEISLLNHLKKSDQDKGENNTLTSKELNRAVKRNRKAIMSKRNDTVRAKRSLGKRAHLIIGSVAASLLILLLFTLYNTLQPTSIASEQTLVQNSDLDLQFSTDINMKRITLADGSVIHLNRETTVALRKGGFNTQTREIWLEKGEAFFEIKKDASRPFIVHTKNGVSTRVLGTSFNIKSYDELMTLEIAVVSGKVQVKNEKSDNIILEPNYKVTVSNKDGQFSPAKTNARAIAQWRTGRVVFENASLLEVAFRVNQYYNMEMIYDAEAFQHDRIYTYFTNETSIEEFSAVIGKLTSSDYSIDDKKIIFHKR